MCHDILITISLLFNRERLNVAAMSNVILIWTLDMHLVVLTISSVPTTVGARTSRPQSLRQNPPILLWHQQILRPKSVLKWRSQRCAIHSSMPTLNLSILPAKLPAFPSCASFQMIHTRFIDQDICPMTSMFHSDLSVVISAMSTAKQNLGMTLKSAAR